MNGPTRTSAFDRPGSVGAGRHKSADIYDELDQFVDAEPPVWGPAHQAPASARSAGSPAEQGDDDRDPAADPYSDRDPALERDPYAERDPATGQPHTAHTVGPVPFVYCGPRIAALRAGGALRDVAPTILDLLGVDRPAEMSGTSLLAG